MEGKIHFLAPGNIGEQNLGNLIRNMNYIYGCISSGNFYRVEEQDIRVFGIGLEQYMKLEPYHWIRRAYPDPDEVLRWHQAIVNYFNKKPYREAEKMPA